MRRRRRLLLVALVLGASVLGASILLRRGEPRYQGKALSAWLRVYEQHGPADIQGERAADAVRHIGTNAMPWLLEALRYQTPSWLGFVGAAAEKAPGPFYRWWQSAVAGRDRGRQAFSGFVLLRGEAAPAIPMLIAALHGQETVYSPSEILALIGRPALPALLSVLTNRADTVNARIGAARAIGLMEKDGAQAAGALSLCLENTEAPQLTGEAAWALGTVKPNPALAVPVLTNALTNSSVEVRRRAAGALGAFGSGAVSAVPALRLSLSDSKEEVRASAARALREILGEGSADGR